MEREKDESKVKWKHAQKSWWEYENKLWEEKEMKIKIRKAKRHDKMWEDKNKVMLKTDRMKKI